MLGDVENYALGARGVARLPGDVKVSGSVRVGRADDAVKLLGALQRRLGRRSGGEGPAKCSGRVAVKVRARRRGDRRVAVASG